jgi:hypothetical protein
MKEFLILRLRNAAIACDQRGDHNMAEIITEAIDELEPPVLEKKSYFSSELVNDALIRAGWKPK